MCAKPSRSTENDTHREGVGGGGWWLGAWIIQCLYHVPISLGSSWGVAAWRQKPEFRLLDRPWLRCSDNNTPVMNDNCVFSTSVYGNLFIDLDYKFWKLCMFNDFFRRPQKALYYFNRDSAWILGIVEWTPVLSCGINFCNEKTWSITSATPNY